MVIEYFIIIITTTIIAIITIIIPVIFSFCHFGVFMGFDICV